MQVYGMQRLHVYREYVMVKILNTTVQLIIEKGV